LAASLVDQPSKSITLRNLKSITGFKDNIWTTKAHPEGLENIPEDIKNAIFDARKKVGIKVMTDKEAESISNYEYQKIWNKAQ